MKTLISLSIFMTAIMSFSFSQSLNISLDPDNFSCGITTVTATTGCNSNGMIAVEVNGMPPGINISNVSAMTEGSFTFDIEITPDAPPSATLNFEALSSDDPTGCILEGFEGTADVMIMCVCDLDVNLVTQDETCFGCNNGSAFASVSGGDGNYTFEWSDGSAENPSGPLSPGTHFVVVTDGSGCSATLTFTIGTYICPGYGVESEITEPQCHGDCNGSIVVSLSNGSNGFEVMWSDNENGAMRIDLCAGSYMLTVVDTDNCSMTSEISLSQPDPLTGDIVDVIPAMNGQNGSIIIGYAGPEPLEAAFIKIDGIPGEINPGNNKVIFSSLAPDCYDIVLEDVTGCTVELNSVCVDNISSVKDNRYTDIGIYPNPATDVIQIGSPHSVSLFDIHVFSINGTCMMHLKNTNNIDVSMLNSGMYILSLKSEKGIFFDWFTKI